MENLTAIQSAQSSKIQINLEKLSNSNSVDSIIAYDVIGEEVTAGDIAEIMSTFAVNFGNELGEDIQARSALLFRELRSCGWTRMRLFETAKWILHHYPYPKWNLATFFEAPQKLLYTYTAYLKAVHEKGKEVNGEIYKYRIDGKMYWSYKKDGLLPFELLDTTAPPIPQPKENVIQKDIETFTSKVNVKPPYQGRFLSEGEIIRERERQLKLLESSGL